MTLGYATSTDGPSARHHLRAALFCAIAPLAMHAALLAACAIAQSSQAFELGYVTVIAAGILLLIGIAELIAYAIGEPRNDVVGRPLPRGLLFTALLLGSNLPVMALVFWEAIKNRL